MRFFAAALLFFGVAASHGQTPEVPHKMKLAGIDLTIREDARQEIQKDVDALTASPKYFNMKAERAKTYFPIIEKIFEEERVPDDLKYLVIQESALVSDAVSVSDAVGFWQFKDFTAQEVGLRVDKDIDERMNIVSSSRGAAKYLKQNNYFFNNWILAVQAYQMGAGGVMRSVDDKLFGVGHMNITSDTYWYVKKFLAHKIAFENAVEGNAEFQLITIEAQAGKSLKDIAKDLTVADEVLTEYNKWMKGKFVPADKIYFVLVPTGEVDPAFTQLAVATPAPTLNRPIDGNVSPGMVPAPSQVQYVNGLAVIYAQQGEYLKEMADRSGIGLSAFLRYNEIFIDHKAKQDVPYYLEKKKSTGEQDFYTALDGQNVWVISQMQGVRASKLSKYNRLAKDETLEWGFPIWLSSRKPKDESLATSAETGVAELAERSFDWNANTSEQTSLTLEFVGAPAFPQPADTTAEPVLPNREPTVNPLSDGVITYHEVVSSDTLYGIARRYGVTIEEVMKWNAKSDFTLAVGERIKILR